jgi:hypothetical protein
LYVLVGYDVRVGKEYLFDSRAKRGVPIFSIEVLAEVITDWFIACSADECAQLETPTTPAQKRAHAAAVRYLRDHELGDWVAEHNDARGVAPRTTAVAEQYDHGGAQIAEVHGVDRGPRRSNLVFVKNRMFFSRWRRRVGVRLGKIPTSGSMPMSTKRDKVASTPQPKTR